jgi:hypothetical protein
LLTLALLPTTGLAQHEQHRPAHPDSAMRMDSSARADTAVSGHGHQAAGMSTGMTGMMQGPLGAPMTRTGSGTSWVPDSSPMYAHHFTSGRWEVMIHGVAYVQEIKQYTDRGDEQFGSINWGMIMANHPLGGGRLQLRGMLSLEPWTVTARGYPLLLQTGESYRGRPLLDRQHPHDLFMEIAALYERPIARELGVSLYLAPVGEPALGPVAYPHRPSALGDPLAPLGHHWQDATHITFGVITMGLFGRAWMFEGSVFNGREPDENRTNFDYAGRSLDSYSGRLTINPTPYWSLSGSYGYLKSPEGLHPEESLHRISASVLHGRTVGRVGEWSTALIWGANKHPGESGLSNSVLLENTLDLDGKNTIFGRAEYVQKTAEDLALGPVPPTDEFGVASFVLGYVREISGFTGGSIGLGVRGALNVIPETLRSTYDTRTPVGFAVFLRFRASRVQMDHHVTEHAPGHHMPRRRDSASDMHVSQAQEH